MNSVRHAAIVLMINNLISSYELASCGLCWIVGLWFGQSGTGQNGSRTGPVLPSCGPQLREIGWFLRLEREKGGAVSVRCSRDLAGCCPAQYGSEEGSLRKRTKARQIRLIAQSLASKSGPARHWPRAMNPLELRRRLRLLRSGSPALLGRVCAGERACGAHTQPGQGELTRA